MNVKKTIPVRIWATIILVMVSCFYSCTKQQLVFYNKPFNRLVSHVWQVEDATIDGISAVAGCSLDNTLMFSADSTMVLDQGAEQCSGGEQRIISGSWQMEESSGGSLKLAFLGLTYEAPILTEKALWLRLKDYNYNGSRVEVVMKFYARN